MSNAGNLPIKREDQNNIANLGSPTKKTKLDIIDDKQNGKIQQKQPPTQNSDEESVMLSDESDSAPNIKIKILKKPKTPSSEESYSEAEQPSEESQVSDEDYVESESQESESEESWDEPPTKGKTKGRKRYSSDSDY